MTMLSVSSLPYCGEYSRQLLAKMGIKSLIDLLGFFPYRYEDQSNASRIASLKEGEEAFIVACPLHYDLRKLGPRKSLLCAHIKDASGECEALWFNQAFIPKTYKVGSLLLLKVKVTLNRYQQLSLHVRQTDFYQPHQSAIQPVYQLTKGLQAYQMKRFIKETLKKEHLYEEDYLPKVYQEKLALIGRRQALYWIHQPPSYEALNQARDRLKFDEFFWLMLPRLRHQYEDKVQGLPCLAKEAYLTQYLNELPYTLTEDQLKAIDVIQEDMSKDVAMNRLLQGDVGCGKTDVAIAALLFCLQAGHSAAFLVPTEILADQHLHKLKVRLKEFNIEICLLKGALKESEKKAIKTRLLQQDPIVVVGTHALLQDSVAIPYLGLVIVDEQHRFGVVQRLRLQKGSKIGPHALFLSATPIPRSMMVLTYGDLKPIQIKSMPAKRQPIKTQVLKMNHLAAVYKHCVLEVEKGRQVFLVYPLINQSDKLDVQAAVEGFELLSKGVFKALRVGLLHGKMPASHKEDIMTKFANHQVDVLVSTTVIEVGINVPNATTMVIMDAHRFGLAQLHQLRGRVGRGEHSSWCFLMSEKSNKRLKWLEKTHDGFILAQKDLELRGPGDVMGTQQSGQLDLKLAHLIKDKGLLARAVSLVKHLLSEDPSLNLPIHQTIARILNEKEHVLTGSLN